MNGVGSDGDMDSYDYKIYTKLMELDHPPRNALFLGGGALVAPKYFRARYPRCFITVVEADREIILLARNSIGINKISIIHKLGREYIDKFIQSMGLIDLIFLDVTMGAMYVPSGKKGRILFPTMLEAQELYLYTVESFRILHSALSPRGVLVINHIGSLTGKKAWIWRSSYQILCSLFGHVRMFPQHSGLPGKPQNILILSSRDIAMVSNRYALARSIQTSFFDDTSKKNLRSAFLDKWYTPKKIIRPVLTDNDVLSRHWNIVYKGR